LQDFRFCIGALPTGSSGEPARIYGRNYGAGCKCYHLPTKYRTNCDAWQNKILWQDAGVLSQSENECVIEFYEVEITSSRQIPVQHQVLWIPDEDSFAFLHQV